MSNKSKFPLGNFTLVEIVAVMDVKRDMELII